MTKYKIPRKSLYSVTALTRGGEEQVRLKINPNKRHSSNNTIIGWNIYKDGAFYQTLLAKEVIE